MNWDQIRGKWNQVKGYAKQEWGELTDDILTQIDGDRDILVGKIQEAYGITREEAHKQVERWEESHTFKKLHKETEDK